MFFLPSARGQKSPGAPPAGPTLLSADRTVRNIHPLVGRSRPAYARAGCGRARFPERHEAVQPFHLALPTPSSAASAHGHDAAQKLDCVLSTSHRCSPTRPSHIDSYSFFHSCRLWMTRTARTSADAAIESAPAYMTAPSAASGPLLMPPPACSRKPAIGGPSR